MLAQSGKFSPVGYRPLLARLVAALLLAAAGLPAATGNSESSPTRLDGDLYADPIAALEHFSPLEESEMAVMRGGLRVGGINIKFGVNLYTAVNGEVIQDSNFILTSTGLEEVLPTNTVASAGTTQTVSVDDLLAPVHTVGGESGNSIGDITSTREGIDLSGLGDAEGVVINSDDGFTAVLHQITQDRIVSFLVTDANNQDIDRRVDVNITIENFTEFQGSVRDALLGGNLTRAVGNATAPR